MKLLRSLAALLGALLLPVAAPAATIGGHSLNATRGTVTYDTTGQKLGTAALSSGVGYLSGSASPGLDNELVFTVEAWVKTSSPGHIAVAVSLSGTYWIGASSSGAAMMGLKAGNVTSSTSISDGAWHHEAMSCDATSCRLYVDGNQVASGAAITSSNQDSSWSFAVGGYTATSSGYDWAGEVDEVAIWGSGRYTASSFTVPTAAYGGTEGMVALYHMDSSGADTATSNAPTTTITVDSLAFHFSPANWKGDTGRGGSAYRQTWNSGAYFTAVWTAASTNPTATLLLATNSSAPAITYFLNGVRTDNVAGSGAISLSPVAGVKNTLVVWVRSVNTSSASWGQASAAGSTVQVQGLKIDTSSSAYTSQAWPTKWVYWPGDSITFGWSTDGNGNHNFLHGHAYYVCRHLLQLGYDCGISAQGGNGWIVGSTYGSSNTADVPAFYKVSGGSYVDGCASSRWDCVDAGVSMLDANGHLSAYGATGTEPAAVVIDLMTNEAVQGASLSDAQASVSQALSAIHAAAPAAKELVIKPFPLLAGTVSSAATSANYLNALLQGVSAVSSSAPTTLIDVQDEAANVYSSISSTFSLSALASDVYHPNVTGHALLAPVIDAGIVGALQASPVTSLRPAFRGSFRFLVQPANDDFMPMWRASGW